ncbi:MAG: lysophospholipid acyltransferase family protein [Ignavibacterium sp.]|jgi:1-acyl-sn-glycerol-3-phosphate acyltransferase|nr:lysophospholipid acyltransferase family protein [Ignavibacterium sp.]
MIKADHKTWAKFVFDIYLKGLLKKSFFDFRIINEQPEIDQSKSLILTPNHFSWWDGFFVYWLNNRTLNKKLFIMMLEDQLKRYWFFQKVGCYSIDLEDNRKMITSLKYTIDLLLNSNNIITIYSQGEIQAYDEKIIVLKDGIDFIAKKSTVDFQILPLAFRIHYSNEKLPIVYARFGKLLNSREIAENPQLFKVEFVNNLELINSEYSIAKYKSIFN